MESRTWQSELTRFRGMPQREKMIWLTRLVMSLTISARCTYVAGTDEVEKPEDLRRFNELIHRVVGYQYRVAIDAPEGMDDATLFKRIEATLEEVGASAGVIHQLE